MTALNAVEARACCACRHWRPRGHRKTANAGQCRNPRNYHGVEYENPQTGKRQLVEWPTTGRYATCQRWGRC